MTNTSKTLELASKHGSPLIIIDHEILKKNYEIFCQLFPRVKPYYAVKANPEPQIINTL